MELKRSKKGMGISVQRVRQFEYAASAARFMGGKAPAGSVGLQLCFLASCRLFSNILSIWDSSSAELCFRMAAMAAFIS